MTARTLSRPSLLETLMLTCVVRLCSIANTPLGIVDAREVVMRRGVRLRAVLELQATPPGVLERVVVLGQLRRGLHGHEGVVVAIGGGILGITGT